MGQSNYARSDERKEGEYARKRLHEGREHRRTRRAGPTSVTRDVIWSGKPQARRENSLSPPPGRCRKLLQKPGHRLWSVAVAWPALFHPKFTDSLLFQRLLIPAGKAAPAPPVGPALGARGVRSADFCKEFNARTAHIEPGVPTPTLITVQPDRSFTFVTRTPPVFYFLKMAAGIEKGPARPGHEVTGTVSLKHVYEIAKIKASDEHMRHLPLEAVARMIVGSARSLGIQVVP